MMRLTEEYIGDVRISGDSSKVFCLKRGSIQAWSTLTGEVVGKWILIILYLEDPSLWMIQESGLIYLD